MKNEYEERFKSSIDLEVKDLHSKYQADKTTFDISIKNISNKAADFEKKLKLLSDDYTRLQNAYNDKIREIEVWQGKCFTLERTYNDDIENLRQEYESQKKASLVKNLYE